MKTRRDPFDTYKWRSKVTTDPYQVIAAFFDYANIVYYRKTIEGILLSAQRDKVYNKETPNSLLFALKKLKSLIKATYLLYKQKKKSPVIILEGSFLDKKYYCRSLLKLKEWDYFPRSLTEKEYCNPYLVFKRFFRFRNPAKWEDILEEITEYALSTDSEGPELDLLSIYFHLNKFVEAAHLIDIREVMHVDGYLKNRFDS